MNPRQATSAEHRLRELAPQVLGALVRRWGDFGTAEDAVQEALLAATKQWPREGVPADPRAWLIRVASRRMADERRARLARERREALVGGEDLGFEPGEDDVTGRDDTLLLLFMSCHPALTRTSAIALTLRAVGGLTTTEIARAFMVPESTMAQRISRAKRTIKESGVPFSMPDAVERAQRLDAVLHVLYLVFNEGYASSGGASLHRVDLSNEAIRLDRAVRHALLDHPETTGLLALMLLTDARRLARTGPESDRRYRHGSRARVRARAAPPLDDDPRMSGGHRLDAVRAHLLERAGQHARARDLYRAAAAKTASIPERDYLLARAARLTRS